MHIQYIFFYLGMIHSLWARVNKQILFISLTLFGCVAFKTQRPFAEGLRPHRALFAVIKSCAQIFFISPSSTRSVKV